MIEIYISMRVGMLTKMIEDRVGILTDQLSSVRTPRVCGGGGDHIDYCTTEAMVNIAGFHLKYMYKVISIIMYEY